MFPLDNLEKLSINSLNLIPDIREIFMVFAPEISLTEQNTL
ncbi:hypothetical protein MYAER_2122 [Microcystis aeruginosa NIES-2549]|uniref:Uncharacterized protein n=1 Tax=Microcystis aeruginosa NIES-2549 TaxID=1641812 RepID=A0A0F6RL86_MICAE|nr:hypothetical protein MYAER_2122 [Microcystis aeruginosa NIES-2549]AOC52868.1 hypothetical protein amyaer_2149 [Microcystis aeruginosa NIES-2481]